MKCRISLKQLLILHFAVLLFATLLEPVRSQQPPQDQEKLPSIFPAKPREPAAGDDELRKLLIARYNSAVNELKMRFQRYEFGQSSLDFMLETARRVADSELELSDKPADQILVCQKLFQFAKDVEKLTESQFRTGIAGTGNVEFARYWRLDAEIKLLKAKRKVAATK